MENRGRWIPVLVATFLIAFGVAACGEEGEPTEAETAARSAPTSPEQSRRGGEDGSANADRGAGGPRDSGGGSGQFRIPGGDNSIQNFGKEADDATREQAAAVLHGYLDARAAGDWARACTYLATEARRMLLEASVKSEQLRGKGCGGIVAAFSRGAKITVREEAAQADVGSLRIEGERGFVIFYGIDGETYTAPMSEEDGRWKLATIVVTPIS